MYEGTYAPKAAEFIRGHLRVSSGEVSVTDLLAAMTAHTGQAFPFDAKFQAEITAAGFVHIGSGPGRRIINAVLV